MSPAYAILTQNPVLVQLNHKIYIYGNRKGTGKCLGSITSASLLLGEYVAEAALSSASSKSVITCRYDGLQES